MRGGTIDYERWYPEVPAVLDTKQLAVLLNTNEQIVRAWVWEGIIPAHRTPGGRKLAFLRHEIFEWLLANRYQPDPDHTS
ncbi:MAG: helix-turn-helix domain-containing protein [Acidimicrobiia bacterium]|nr:helix-turn-helix domain-containing protein [Acidimicrobiia bacterium]MDH5616182.1 helix-turn-helix domain-containing protein [Acidimicrobiia bacterium]